MVLQRGRHWRPGHCAGIAADAGVARRARRRRVRGCGASHPVRPGRGPASARTCGRRGRRTGQNRLTRHRSASCAGSVSASLTPDMPMMGALTTPSPGAPARTAQAQSAEFRPVSPEPERRVPVPVRPVSVPVRRGLVPVRPVSVPVRQGSVPVRQGLVPVRRWAPVQLPALAQARRTEHQPCQ